MTRRLPWLFVLLAVFLVGAFVHVAGGLEGLGIVRPEPAPGASDLRAEAQDELVRTPVRLGGQGEALRGPGEILADGAGATDPVGGRGTRAEGTSPGVVVAFGGVVKDSGAHPVEGVRVSLLGSGGTVQDVETDAEGRFVAQVPAGRYTLRFDSPAHGGLALRAYVIDGAAGTGSEFVLRDAVRLEATVLEAGRALGDVEVTLESSEGFEPAVTRTDASGIALFERVVAGSYTVIATRSDGPSLRRPLQLAQDGTTQLEFPPGVTLQATVRDARTGVSIAGARLDVEVRVGGRTTVTAHGESGPDGQVELQVPQGTVRSVGVAADGYASWPSRADRRSAMRDLSAIAGGRPARLDVALTEGMRLEGLVASGDGKPVGGLVLRFVPRRGGALEATTTDEGLYALEGVDAERYTGSVMSEGWYSQDPLRVTVPRGEPGAVHVLDVTVQPTLAVEGFVHYAKGKPAAGARIWLTGGGRLLKSARLAGRDLETFSDASGWWRLADLPADQSVVLRASIGTLESPPRGIRTSDLPAKAIDLRLQATVTLRGRVFDLVDRRAVAGATVRITPQGAPGGRTPRTVTTDAAGSYVSFELIPGGWRIEPSHRAYRMGVPRDEVLARDDGEVEVDLQLDPGLVIAGTVVDAGGHRLPRVSVAATGAGPEGRPLRRNARTDASGAFRLSGLAPGSYEVVAYLGGFRRARLGNVAAGNDRLLVTLTPAGPR